jgi:hypothetical protein
MHSASEQHQKKNRFEALGLTDMHAITQRAGGVGKRFLL